MEPNLSRVLHRPPPYGVRWDGTANTPYGRYLSGPEEPRRAAPPLVEGPVKKGGRPPRVAAEDIAAMRRLRAEGETTVALAARYGLSRSMVSRYTSGLS